MFGVDEGMKGNECNGGNPAIWRMEDGSLWFPTTATAWCAWIRRTCPATPWRPPVVIEGLLRRRPAAWTPRTARASRPAGTAWRFPSPG